MRARPKPAKIALDDPADRTGRGGEQIYVHVGGAVREGGLFRLPEGARVDDAVRAAGGPTDDADLDGLNLAAKVKDGDKVLVPRVNAQPGLAADREPQGSTLVNLNSATAAELEELPGVGPAIAERIVAYRTEHGGFQRIEDLMEVPGIGPKKYEELKDHVTV